MSLNDSLMSLDAYCNFTNFRCIKISVASDHRAFSLYLKFRCPWMPPQSLNVFSHLGVFSILVKPLTTENSENL